MKSYVGAVCAVILQVFCVSAPALAQQRVYADGEKPADSRLGELRHLNNYFPFHVPDSLDGWKARQDQLRTRILVANGIWPLPERTPSECENLWAGRTQRLYGREGSF